MYIHMFIFLFNVICKYIKICLCPLHLSHTHTHTNTQISVFLRLFPLSPLWNYFFLSFKSTKSFQEFSSHPRSGSQRLVHVDRENYVVQFSLLVLIRGKSLRIWNHLLCPLGRLITDTTARLERKNKFQLVSMGFSMGRMNWTFMKKKGFETKPNKGKRKVHICFSRKIC